MRLLSGLRLARPIAAGCDAAGAATPPDDAGDCAALVSLYAALGGLPEAWGTGMSAAAGRSYCSWDLATITCTDSRVTALCAPLPLPAAGRDCGSQPEPPPHCSCVVP